MRHGHGLSLQSVATQNVAAAGFTLDVTGAQLRDALANPSAWGETLGPELVSNGGFDSGTGWTVYFGAIAAGAYSYDGVLIGGGTLVALQDGRSFVSGRTYRVVYTIGSIFGGNASLRIASAGAEVAVTNSVSAAGTYTQNITLNAAADRVGIVSRGGGFSSIAVDNISIREVVTGWLLPGLGGARLSGDCRTSVAMETVKDDVLGPARTVGETILTQGGGSATDNGGNSFTLVGAASAPSVRLRIPLAELRNGAVYEFRIDVSAVTGAPTFDWCDEASTTITTTGLKVFRASRSTYDASFRFFDLLVFAGQSLTFTVISVREVQIPAGGIGYSAHNLLTYSADVSNAVWNADSQSKTAAVAVAPDGTTTVGRFTLVGTGVFYPRNTSFTLVAGQTYTLSAWVQLPTGTVGDLRLAIYDGSWRTGSNLIGSLTTTLQRVSFTFTAAGASAVGYGFYISGSAGATVDHWGLQLNLGTVATAYVPTTTAARFAPAIDWLAGIGVYGIRSEAARTNLFPWSSDLTAVGWGPFQTGTGAVPTVTKNFAIAPDGTMTANRVQLSLGGGTTTVDRSGFSYPAGVPLDNVVRTLSVYMKNNGATAATVLTRVHGIIVYTTLLVGAAWIRVPVTAGALSDATCNPIELRGAQPTANSDAADVLVWVPQLEVGTEASSPILTYGAAATRAADTLVVLDSGWINQGEGTLVVDSTVPSLTGLRGVASLNDGTGNNVVQAYQNATAAAYEVVVGGATQASGTQAITLVSKRAIGYAANNVRWATNNVLGTLDTSATMPTVNRLTLGTANGLDFANGTYITRIRYSRRRASNGQLQALTV